MKKKTTHKNRKITQHHRVIHIRLRDDDVIGKKKGQLNIN